MFRRFSGIVLLVNFDENRRYTGSLWNLKGFLDKRNYTTNEHKISLSASNSLSSSACSEQKHTTKHNARNWSLEVNAVNISYISLPRKQTTGGKKSNTVRANIRYKNCGNFKIFDTDYSKLKLHNEGIKSMLHQESVS